MNKKFNIIWRVLASLLMLLGLAAPAFPARAAPQPAALAAPIANWCVAGSFNGWDNNLNALNDDGTAGDLFAGDGIYSLDYTIPTAGRQEWKAVKCEDWSTSYPAENAWLYTTVADQLVKFTLDTNDHSTDAGWDLLPATNIVNANDDLPTSFTAVGSFQSPTTWDNDDPATLMTSLGHGLYYLAYTIPAAGTYIGKVTATGTWDAFGAGGRSKDAANVSFTTTSASQVVVFLLDAERGRLIITPHGSPVAGSWCVPGAFNGWDNTANPLYDDGTHGDLLAGDGIFSLDYTVATADRYEWKISACGNWSTSYPPQNAWLNTSADGQSVKFTFDVNDHSSDVGFELLPASNIVNVFDDLATSFTVVGDFQGWVNNDPATLMTSIGSGLYMLNYTFAAPGTYEGKATATGTWDAFGTGGRMIDQGNLTFEVFDANAVVLFVLDAYSGRLNVFPPPPAGGASHDNTVWWAELGHNSRDPLYRTPGGPVSTGTAVTLRLRAAAGDLTAAQVRVWNDRLDADTTYNLALAASDAQYDWWEVTLPASADSTIYWYRFIAIDGSDTDYYEDDSGRTGGWGQAFDEPADNSWQLTIYKDGYTTPDWVKNAIFYQIFPDRFRDGDLDNHTPAGTAFYDEPNTVFRSNQANWNQPICDPRDAAGPCPGAYSQNFYGGDLQGILDQLDYIEELGITAIYLNPIFESPSNHKYDASDYSVIDDNFGNLALFESLVQGANDRGIRVILDGVFNHTSSDSLYFDRYHRYASDGACESATSEYRDWYYFTDVTPGTGSCVSSTGVANGANYESWWGYDSLPKLDSTNEAVRDLIYSGPGDPIAMYWVDEDHPRADGWRLDVGADVDPGTTNDPTNLYWDEFRTAVHSANPEGYIVGEEWSYGTAWLIGDEWDAVMNYKFSTAVLGFWREGSFTDNDHNTGSSAGPINELTPSQLNERLLDLQERYPAEALYAMLNLLDSHDTNRALFMLDSRTGENDASIYLQPDYDWSDAIVRLRGTAILQLTLPGAPTIYYGDEVGLVGPTIYAGGKWEDDPYNRQPFPWLDLVGDEPFYDHLTTQAGQDAIRDHYILLTTARNNHPALRTGSFDPLLVDDTDLVYAYGRKEIDTATPANSDAAVVILNRDTAAHTFTYDLSSYLPAGTVLTDVLDTVAPYTYTVQADGSLSPALNVSPMFGAVLVLASGSLNAPDAPLNLLAIEGISQVDLAWDASTGAASYNLYRSPLSGGGYELITNTTALTYTDIAVVNSTWYYYVVTAVGTNGMQSDYSNEAAAMPHYAIGDAFIQWPPAITHTIGLTPTENIYGRILIDGGVTAAPGATPGLLAQVGFGPTTTHPLSWTWWSDAAYNVDNGGYDEFAGSLTPEYTGDFGYAYRFSTTSGRDWVYADQSGIFTDTLTNPGPLFVNPSTDIIAPTAPLSLTLSDWDSSYLELTWQPATDETSLYAYDVFRSEISGTLGTHVGRVTAPATVFTDTGVTTNLTYYYVVQALDTSFNRSDYSNEVEGTPKPKVVQVTFNVGVPDDTPGTVYIVGDHPALATWTPGALPMTYNITDSVWTRTVELPDKQPIQFKFTRGSWERVEWWGSIVDTANRHAVVDYGTDGTQVINLTATDWGIGDDDTKAVQYWRDPYVIDFAPADLAVMVPNDTTIWAAWGKPMTDTTTFEVEGPGGPITGTFAYDDLTRPTTVFTPSLILPPGIYTVTVIDQISADGQSQQIPATWQFMVGPLPTVQLTSAAYSAAEVDGAAVVTATLNTPSLASVTVDYATANGTALAGDDYTALDGTLTFAPGETELLITLNLTDDLVYEGDEAFTITITNPTGAALGSPAAAAITILDDEALPTVQLAGAALYTGEADGPAVLTVTLSGPSVAPVTVDYLSSDGTALAGDDYTALDGTLTFAPGETELLITLNLTDDLVYEGDEAFTVTLTNPTGAALGSPAAAAITILDDEALPTVQLAGAALSLGEADGPAMLTVTLSGPSAAPVTVDYLSSDGTALAGDDYTAIDGTLTFAPGETELLITLNLTDDLVYEGDEAFTVTLTDPTGAALGSPAAAAITILDDEALPTVQLAAPALYTGEDDGPAALVFTLSGPSTSPITVSYATANGTALAGDDYTAVNGTLTFTPGETQKFILVNFVDDIIYEENETFTFTISNPVNAALGSPIQTVLTINDNEALPTVQLAGAALSLGEADGPAMLTVTLSGPSAAPVTVSYATANGTALAGDDYTAIDGMLTFAPGETQKVIAIALVNDTLVESDETFTLTLSSPTGAALGSPSQAVLTILDDDEQIMYWKFLPILFR